MTLIRYRAHIRLGLKRVSVAIHIWSTTKSKVLTLALERRENCQACET